MAQLQVTASIGCPLGILWPHWQQQDDGNYQQRRMDLQSVAVCEITGIFFDYYPALKASRPDSI